MNRTRKKTGRACLSLLVIVMLMSVLCPAALADTDGLSQIRSRGKARLYRSRLSRHKTPLRMWRSRKNLMQTQAASQSAR